jgi:hypothetical protein
MTNTDVRLNSYREQTRPKPMGSAVLTLLHRLWPLTSVGIALLANAIWIGFLGYWLFKLL